MTLSAEKLNAARDDIAIVIKAFRSSDASDVSADGNSLVAELVDLDDAGWDCLLENLEDDELREQMEWLRQILTERVAATGHHIRQVGHSASFNISPPALTVSLTLRAGDKTLVTRHDLENTLWVGVAVVQVVSQTMQSMKDTLNLPAQRACIGSNFEDNLECAEAAIAEVRHIYEVVRNTDMLD